MVSYACLVAAAALQVAKVASLVHFDLVPQHLPEVSLR